MIEIDLQSRVPIYDQMVRSVIKLRAIGILKPNDPLPSVRALAMQLGINPNTVSKAFKLLEAHGVIYTVAGKGCYVSPLDENSNQLVKLAERRIKEAIIEGAQIGISKSSAIKIVDDVYEQQERSGSNA